MAETLDYARPETQRRRDHGWIDLVIGLCCLGFVLIYAILIPFSDDPSDVFSTTPLLPWIATFGLVLVGVVTISMPRPISHRRQRLTLIALLALLAGAFWFSGAFGWLWNMNMRVQVARAGGLDPLVAWARQTMANPPPKTAMAGYGGRPVWGLTPPPQYKGFATYDAMMEADAAGTFYVRVYYWHNVNNRDDFVEWGLLIGPPGWKPEDTRKKYQWADGVWSVPQ